MDEQPNEQPATTIVFADPRIIFSNQAFISLSANDESVHFDFVCDGVGAARFALHPKHAKRFLLRLQKVIGDYEQRNGELKTELPNGGV